MEKGSWLNIFFFLSETRLQDEVTKSSQQSRMYQVQESITPSGKGLPNLFSTPDEKWHGTVLKPIGTYFSASGINSLENYINNSINILIDELKTFVNTNRHCDIADYFLRCK